MISFESFLINLVSKLKYVDKRGNKYYTSIFGGKRFVVYSGITDPAKIPPKYYLWLHKLIDEVSNVEDDVNLAEDKSKFSGKINKVAYYSSWAPKTNR
jgi:NADH:ubiquinone oxidoreductase subunit